jgi:hypothetical protein
MDYLALAGWCFLVLALALVLLVAAAGLVFEALT